jgi:hypothetical protein
MLVLLMLVSLMLVLLMDEPFTFQFGCCWRSMLPAHSDVRSFVERVERECLSSWVATTTSNTMTVTVIAGASAAGELTL